MKFQTYTPTEAMVMAVQWPENPIGKDFNDLKHWVGDDLELRIVGTKVVTVINCGLTALDCGSYLVRNDDRYEIYSQKKFEDTFMEVR